MYRITIWLLDEKSTVCCIYQEFVYIWYGAGRYIHVDSAHDCQDSPAGDILAKPSGPMEDSAGSSNSQWWRFHNVNVSNNVHHTSPWSSRSWRVEMLGVSWCIIPNRAESSVTRTKETLSLSQYICQAQWNGDTWYTQMYTRNFVRGRRRRRYSDINKEKEGQEPPFSKAHNPFETNSCAFATMTNPHRNRLVEPRNVSGELCNVNGATRVDATTRSRG